ncbi:bifunctional transcriptional activator/DNA repair enzyme AdaA [Flexibacterium corallicola]|uniref:bifunctional transcriptional activator/DNA repair enzyme AdaA n=1 Tax=Flexibacterium corallicola TaxID=3037259 RepID=UPI00286F0521|nr:trifunctional transcriptional activator/DNA repair protein Ada/methylated-DNA--[protein]-cysteine S-methyltransferase [Pseudovibrio sp. M1P-2-3]
MLFKLLDYDRLYEALLRRDADFDGRVFVGVKSTGIFCRLTCPARKPKKENCKFFECVAECMEAGFRPCKRCSPLTPAAEVDVTIKTLMRALEDQPSRRWRESDIEHLGFDPSTVRRSFKRHYGMTFLEMARISRLRESFTTLAEGGRVIDAQVDAGFSSPNAFRTAFAKLLGETPGSFTEDALLKADWIETPLGAMIAVSDKSSLHLLEFVDRKALPTELNKLKKAAGGQIGIGRFEPIKTIEGELNAFFDGRSDQFKTPLTLHGSAFSRDVWRALREIPTGQTKSYSQIAHDIGNANAVRAVARANGANQIAIVIPCHRVIGADGTLTGYGGGLWRKQKLIELERTFSGK